VDPYVEAFLNDSEDRGDSLYGDWSDDDDNENIIVPTEGNFTVPHQYWIENTPGGKEDDIKALGVLLHEMATLSSSLSLLYRIDSHIARPPIPTQYTHAFNDFLRWLN